MNINLRLAGELEAYIESFISRGFAANKTEAARMVIARHYEEDMREMAPFEQMRDGRSQKVGAYLEEGYAGGKLKALSEAEFRKKHAKLLK